MIAVPAPDYLLVHPLHCRTEPSRCAGFSVNVQEHEKDVGVWNRISLTKTGQPPRCSCGFWKFPSSREGGRFRCPHTLGGDRGKSRVSSITNSGLIPFWTPEPIFSAHLSDERRYSLKNRAPNPLPDLRPDHHEQSSAPPMRPQHYGRLDNNERPAPTAKPSTGQKRHAVACPACRFGGEQQGTSWPIKATLLHHL